jgi:hypothetical protein
MSISNKLPTVLTFEGKQNSISVLRALKNIKEVMELVDAHADFVNDDAEDRFQTAIDDLDLLIGAVKD